MSRGRRPEPAQSKVLRGNFRPSRDSHGPEVELATPKCPAWLPKSAKAYWREIVPHLERSGLISVIDGAAFSAHCDSFSRYEDVTRHLTAIGDMIDTTPNGYQVQHVLFQIRNKLWDQVMRSAHEFGLSPSARSSFKSVPQQQLPPDEWGDV